MIKHNDSQIIRYFLEYNDKLLRHVYHSEMYFAMQTKYILLKTRWRILFHSTKTRTFRDIMILAIYCVGRDINKSVDNHSEPKSAK